jgi:GWxTD domain-containing protein
MFWEPLRHCLSSTFFVIFLIAALPPVGRAQSNPTSETPTTTPGQPTQADPLQRPLPGKKQQKGRLHIIDDFGVYRRWLDQDVPYIITPEERAAFKQLSNDEERDQFIEAFWQRRDPTPDTLENEFKKEHYRRIAYANEHFGAGVPGWKTDRGRIYIIHGAPDEIESSPAGGTYERTPQEGGGSTSTFPFER